MFPKKLKNNLIKTAKSFFKFNKNIKFRFIKEEYGRRFKERRISKKEHA